MRESSAAARFTSLLHQVFLVLLFTEWNVAVASIFVKFASTPLAINSVVHWLARSIRRIKVGSTTFTGAISIASTHRSSELQALNFPLRHAPRWCLFGRLSLCTHRRLFLLSVSILLFFKSFTVGISGFAVLLYFELFAFFHEHFLAYLYVLLQSRGIE